MHNNLLIILLIGHFLGDYYFQNDRLAKGKKEKISHLFIHGCIYLVISTLLVLPMGQIEALLLVLVITLAHVCIDGIKYSVAKIVEGRGHTKVNRLLKKWEEQGLIYSVDQLLHIALIVIVVYGYSSRYGNLMAWHLPFGTWSIRNDVLRYILAILIILKPTNITFRALFAQNKPSDKITFTRDLKTGQRIGNMERLLVLAFLGLNQYTAIGLVFTAKSVTRYKRIIDDTAFAEYYLLGTLFSILATLAVYLVLFVII